MEAYACDDDDAVSLHILFVAADLLNEALPLFLVVRIDTAVVVQGGNVWLDCIALHGPIQEESWI